MYQKLVDTLTLLNSLKELLESLQTILVIIYSYSPVHLQL